MRSVQLNVLVERGQKAQFLVNFVQRRVYVYRPGVPVEQLDNPETVSGDPELPGFVLKLGEIW